MDSALNRGRGRGLGKAALVLVLVVFSAAIIYLYGTPGAPEGAVRDVSGVLNTSEAMEWISGCEQRNPYIRDRCTDLFYYELALEEGDESFCGPVEDEGIKGHCTEYFGQG